MKVSVIMPSLNVVKYIRQAVESVLVQTLDDIEVIFVDAGSTDGTIEILEEYTKKDPRTKLLRSEKKSYGYQVNIGFDAAQGEYLGIIETDDYADPNMFEKLYACAKENDADVVKSGFYYYYSKDGEKNIPEAIASESMSCWTFCPVTDFKAPLEKAEFFNIKPTIWSAIYRRDFIYENRIRLNETPGASYQDASFNFMVWACATRVRLLPDCFLHYRQDNEASSINSTGKIYCICDEYEKMESFLDDRPALKGELDPILARIKYDSYNWNYNRLSGKSAEDFLDRFHSEFMQMNLDGRFERDFFEGWRWEQLNTVIKDPEEFSIMKKCKESGIPYRPNTYTLKQFSVKKVNSRSKASIDPRKYEGKIGKIRAILETARWNLSHNGIKKTIGFFTSRIAERLSK